MYLYKCLWSNILDKINKRTYNSTTPNKYMGTMEPIKLSNIAGNIFRAILGIVRYILFTSICGLAFYFLLRSI